MDNHLFASILTNVYNITPNARIKLNKTLHLQNDLYGVRDH